MIAGCSAGSAVGAFYASGMKPSVIKKALSTVKWKEMFDFVMPKKGLIKGNKLEQFLESTLQNKNFKNLDIPLYIVATNISKRKKAIFHRGSVAKAVRASIAIPGIFNPIQINGDDYLDGGLVDPIPVDILKQKGADVIIAVDLSSDIEEMEVAGEKVRARKNFADSMREKIVVTEINFLKEFLKAKDLAKDFVPKMLRNLFRKIKIYIVDKFVRPTLVFRYFSKSQVPQILSMMYSGIDVMEDEFTKAKLKNGSVDVIISPTFNQGDWTDMDKSKYFIRQGSHAAKLKIKEIKKTIRRAKHRL